jgi:putative nucleotidyltransferase with HDIG domain
MLNTKALMNRLGGKLSLPSLPEVVLRVQDRVTKSDCSIKELGELIAEDPPLCARILRIANSAYYSLSVPVLEIGHAAAILGVDTLQIVVLQVALADMFEHMGDSGAFKPSELWKHSILTAQLAASLPHRTFSGVTKGEVYVAGLLHDIGKFILFDHLRAEFADATLLAASQGRPLWQVEEEIFGFNHAEVGELVATRWGLPTVAVRAIGRHHCLGMLETEAALVSIIAAANHIANNTYKAKNEEMRKPLPSEVIDQLKLSDGEIEDLVEKAFLFQES